MAKGYVGYINQVWKKLEQQLLLDAYLKQDCNDPSEDLDLLEDIAFEEDHQLYIINEKYTGMDLKSIPLRNDFQRT